MRWTDGGCDGWDDGDCEVFVCHVGSTDPSVTRKRLTERAAADSSQPTETVDSPGADQ